MDQLWVPTHFAKDIFEANGVVPEKLRVLGEPVDVGFFDPEKHTPLAIDGVGPNSFVLLSIFKWYIKTYICARVHTEPSPLDDFTATFFSLKQSLL